jgi:hypothetical protein
LSKKLIKKEGKMSEKKTLGEYLVEVFAAWVGTESEALLDDLGVVKDHLADTLGRAEVETYGAEEWSSAWKHFDKEVSNER